MAYCGHYVCSSHENAVDERDQFDKCHECAVKSPEQKIFLEDAVLNGSFSLFNTFNANWYFTVQSSTRRLHRKDLSV